MYKIAVFIPEDHLDAVKLAMFHAGAGRIGDYEHCCWQTLGYGQFKPGVNAKPFIGEQGVVSKVAEYKVEMVCEDASVKNVIGALREAHPYEEPAFDVWKLMDF